MIVQLKFLSGKMAGTEEVARHFPFRVGRGAQNDLRIEEDGVWENHFEIGFDAAEGFILDAKTDALVTVNHEPAKKLRLRNGDSIEAGSARIQFWLGQPDQRGMRLREAFVWSLVVGVTLAQVALMCWLLG